MSQENVEIVRLAFDAIGRRDIDALLKLYDERIEFLPLTGTRVESDGYAGQAGVRVITVQDGKIIRHRGYHSGEEALEAVGLSE